MLKRLLLVRGAELALFAFLVAVPLAVQSSYALGLLTLLAIYGILLIGLDVTVGYLGQVNLGQASDAGQVPPGSGFGEWTIASAATFLIAACACCSIAGAVSCC